MLIKLILALVIGYGGIFAPGSAQNLLDRLRPVNMTRFDDGIKVVSGTKVKRYERLTVPLGGPVGIPGAAGLLGPLLPPQPSYLGYTYVSIYGFQIKLYDPVIICKLHSHLTKRLDFLCVPAIELHYIVQIQFQ